MAKDVKKKDATGKGKESKLTPFEQELVETMKKVKEYKLLSEASIVSIIYSLPDIIYSYNLKLEDFTNNIWKVYFEIAYSLLIKEQKQVLDEVTIGFYLEKHPKLKEKYDEYGGYETISNATAYVKVDNMQGFVTELSKWNVVIKLIKMKFPVQDRLSEFADMSADEIYAEYEAKLNHVFVNLDGDIKSYDITYQLDELIDEMNEGNLVGLPYHEMPMLNRETSGQLAGNITLIGGLSNCGKSSFVRNLILPSVIKFSEPIVIILNEENFTKWQSELLVFVANNVLKKDLQKYIVRDGKYTDEVKEILKQAANWIKEKAKDRIITIIPFQSYSTDKAIKVIKKYSALANCKHFVLDTFKMDAGKVSANAWMELSQSMVSIYDTIKESSLNVHITITVQLSKTSARQRVYLQDNIAEGKGIINSVSTCLMIRDIWEDEYPNGKRALNVVRLDGKNLKSKIPVQLDKNKKYQCLFIVKNRAGAANSHSIVMEVDHSRNYYKEVGLTVVPNDY